MFRGVGTIPASRLPSDWWLENRVSSGSLGVAAAKGGLLLGIGQSAQLVVQLVGVYLLARLLMPSDFGLVAMAATVTLFAALFTDLGFSLAVIRAPSLNQRMMSTLFFLTFMAGIAAGAACFVLAPAFASFYNDDRLTHLIAVLALTLPLSAASAQHQALLTRFMRWRSIQAIALIAQVTALGAAIGAAFVGAGYWAIAVQALIAAAVNLVMSWGLCSWRPDPILVVREVKPEVGFGLNLTAFGLINWFHRQGDNMLIGWRWGSETLGFYTRAYTLYVLPLNAINGPLRTVCLPMLSRSQENSAAWKNGALDTLAISTLAGTFLAASVVAAAEPVVLLLFGTRWEESISIFRWLSLSLFVACPMNMLGTILTSRGRSGRLLVSGLINCTVLFTAFFVAVPFGARGVAIAYSITYLLLFVPTVWLALSGSSLSLSVALRQMVPLQLVGLVALLLSDLVSLDLERGTVTHLVGALAPPLAAFILLTAALLHFDPVQARLKAQVTFLTRRCTAACRSVVRRISWMS